MSAPERVLVPMTVRAHLAHGVATAGAWGIALDGLLAAQLWARHKADIEDAGGEVHGLDVDDPADLDLPLARCTTPGGLWHWAATCAHPEDRVGDVPEVRYWSGRVDHPALEQLATELPATISDRQGRYRARRMPLLATVCRSVSWQAVGDPAAVQALCEEIAAIGKKRSTGEGHVLRWEITPTPSADRWAAAHLHPDGTLGRTTPPHCLTGRTVPDGGEGLAGLRPPYMHHARQAQLRLPVMTA